jgi:adenine-specific DNA-methyltransferase
MSNAQAEKMKLTSLDIAAEKRDQLKQVLQELLPEAVNESGIDFDQMKRALGEWVESGKERFGLQWPGKAECMKVIQQPSVATLKPARKESVNFDETENLFIEGDNLEVLKLLQKPYFGKIKMIYIDPPYNTGKEFIYPDKFSETLDTYLSYTGQTDDEGRKFSTNAESSGRYHSRWLSMMYPRLYLAKNLLVEDGILFISIDDNEQANLKLLCDSVFGEENHLGTFLWKRRQNADSRNQSNISPDHEYILAYAKNSSARVIGTEIDITKYQNPDNDDRGPWASIDLSGLATKEQRPNLHYDIVDQKTGLSYPPNPNRGWSKSKDNVIQMISEGRILFPKNPEGRPREKKFLNDLRSNTTGFSTWLDSGEVGYTTHGTREVTELFDNKIFDFPKPSELIKLLIKQSTGGDDIILDFFSGSATTAHAIFNANIEDSGNRKFVLVQLPEPIEEGSVAAKAGHKHIADIGKERIRRVAKKLAENQDSQLNLKGGKSLDLGFKVFKLDRSNFKVWEGSVDHVENLEKQLSLHVDHIAKGSTPEDILYELLLKAGFSLSTKVEKLKIAGKEVFSIHEGALLICLEKELTQPLIDALAEANPLQVICLDEGFKGNDQLKANAVQTFKARAQAEESEIVFKTV